MAEFSTGTGCSGGSGRRNLSERTGIASTGTGQVLAYFFSFQTMGVGASASKAARSQVFPTWKRSHMDAGLE